MIANHWSKSLGKFCRGPPCICLPALVETRVVYSFMTCYFLKEHKIPHKEKIPLKINLMNKRPTRYKANKT